MKGQLINLAILASHPIQYQVPLFLELVKDGRVDITVYFCWDARVDNEHFDKEFNFSFEWDIPLLRGYKHIFLRNISFKPSSKFWGQVNPGILRILLRKQHDALLVFGWNGVTNWIAFLVAFLIRTPVFVRGENPINQELLKKSWKLSVKKIILGWLFKQSSGLLYIGNENMKFYQHYGVPNEKLFFTPYAVDNKRLMYDAQRFKYNTPDIRQWLGIKKDAVVVLFTGKFINKKRPLDLLKAFDLLKTKYSINNKVLIFVGDGMLRSDLEGYVKEKKIDNVHFVGFKNQTELPAYYAISDIFVLPSNVGETWGLVVNEAMCFGLPIIVSDIVGCSSDLVESGKNGFIFKTGDIEQLASYINILLSDGSMRKKFGNKSLEIINKYSYEEDLKGILKAISK